MPRPPAERPFAFSALVPYRRGMTDEILGEIVTGDPSNPRRNRKKVRRWIERGLTVWEADTIATRLGVHPSAVWGPEFYQGALDVADQCEVIDLTGRADVWTRIRWELAAADRRRMEADAMFGPTLTRAEIVRGYQQIERARDRRAS